VLARSSASCDLSGSDQIEFSRGVGDFRLLAGTCQELIEGEIGDGTPPDELLPGN